MKVGSLVELVDDSRWTLPKAPFEKPVKGRIYTVRQVINCPTAIGIRLEEIYGRNYLGHKTEIMFDAKRFRELQPPMEISIEAILEMQEK